MQDVESILKTTMLEIEKVLSSKSVIGEPINVDGNTIIPLVSIGFGFGGGQGGDNSKSSGIGAGGGGGIKPVATIVVPKEGGVRIDSVYGGTTAKIIETTGEAVGNIVEKSIKAKNSKEDSK